jgi:hypothetical protein
MMATQALDFRLIPGFSGLFWERGQPIVWFILLEVRCGFCRIAAMPRKMGRTRERRKWVDEGV